MWICFAALSALCVGACGLLSKMGLGKVTPTTAAAARGPVILLTALAIHAGRALIPAQDPPQDGSAAAFGLLCLLSGIAAAVAWITYFAALSQTDPVCAAAADKTSVLFAALMSISIDKRLPEDWLPLLFVAIGIVLLIRYSTSIDKPNAQSGYHWLIYALPSAGFAALAAILGRRATAIGSPTAALVIRAGVVMLLCGGWALCRGSAAELCALRGKSLLFIGLSGMATGLGWLFSLLALSGGSATAVQSIEKLSVWVTLIVGRMIWREPVTKGQFAGICIFTAGALAQIL